MQTNDEPQAEHVGSWRFFNQHFAVICALFVVVFASIKVFFAAGLQTPTALSILAVADRTQLLSATVISALSIVVPYLLFVPQFTRWLFNGNGLNASIWQQILTACLWSPTLVFAVTSMTLPVLGGFLITLVTIVVMRVTTRRKGRHIGERKGEKITAQFTRGQAWAFASMSGILLINILGQPWIAREAVTLAGNQIEISRVVGAQGEMTLLIVEPGRQVLWVHTDKIEKRELCAPEPTWSSSPLLQFLYPSENGADCSAIVKSLRAG